MSKLLVVGAIVLVVTVLVGAHGLYIFNSAPLVTIRNQSSAVVTDVRIECTDGCTISVPDLVAGESRSVSLPARGESSVIVAFLSPTGPVRTDCGVYIERQGGYFVDVKIAGDFTVTCQSGFRSSLTGLPIRAD